MTNTILGVPDFIYGIMYPQTFTLSGAHTTTGLERPQPTHTIRP